MDDEFRFSIEDFKRSHYMGAKPSLDVMKDTGLGHLLDLGFKTRSGKWRIVVWLNKRLEANASCYNKRTTFCLDQHLCAGSMIGCELVKASPREEPKGAV